MLVAGLDQEPGGGGGGLLWCITIFKLNISVGCGGGKIIPDIGSPLSDVLCIGSGKLSIGNCSRSIREAGIVSAATRG